MSDEHLVSRSHIGRDNIQIGSNVHNVAIFATPLLFRIEEFCAQPQPLAPSPYLAPSALLDVSHAAIPFRGRAAELRVLKKWLDEDSPNSIHSIYGPGGQGKSRLAHKIATIAQGEGWLVEQAIEASDPTVQVSTASTTATSSTLFMVDYADRWRLSTLVGAILDARKRAGSQKLRVLLIGRSVEYLWADLVAELGRTGISLEEPLLLVGLDSSVEARSHAYKEVALHFAAALGVSIDKVDLDRDVSGDEYTSPLTLQMAALAAICSSRDGEEAPAAAVDLSRFLLEHERRYWIRMLNSSSVEGQARSVNLVDFEQIVSVATLIGPMPLKPAQQVLRGLEAFSAPGLCEDLVRLHEKVYPQIVLGTTGLQQQYSRQILNPLHPDRLGEDYIGQNLAKNAAYRTASSLLSGHVSEDAIRQALHVLAASSERHDSSAQMLVEAFEEQPTLVRNSTALILNRLTQISCRSLLLRVASHVPSFDLDLNRAAYELAVNLADNAPSGTSPSELGLLYADAGTRAANVGERSAALRYAETAVKHFRKLVGRGRAEQLAPAYHALSLRLSETGDQKTALEFAQKSVGIYQKDLRGQPAFMAAHATALANLSVRLVRLGRTRAALRPIEESVAFYRRLSAIDDEAMEDHLASSLGSMAKLLLSSGRYNESVEASSESLRIRERLVDRSPKKYLPDYARSLTNHAAILYESEESNPIGPALEAVRIFQDLSELEPEAYLPRLADALNNASACYLKLGEEAEAAKFSKKAVEILRRLDRGEPGVHSRNLALALANHGMQSSGIGDESAALSCTRESVRSLHRLRSEEPDGYSEDFAKALLFFAMVRVEHEFELDEAGGAAAESMGILMELSGRYPERYSLDLHRSIETAAAAYEKCGAEDLARQARRLLRALHGESDERATPAVNSEKEIARRRAALDILQRRAGSAARRGVHVPIGPEGPVLPEGSTNPAEVRRIAGETSAEAAFLFTDDHALGAYDWAIERDRDTGGLRIGDGDLDARFPVVAFEFEKMVMMTNRVDGSSYELQVEGIHRSGFIRLWTGVQVVPEMPGWAVGRTASGTSLLDRKGGLWASASLQPASIWRAAAEKEGRVLVLYGVRLGVRKPYRISDQQFSSSVRAKELREARALGLVGAGLVRWEPR
ncbi:tetratricopeptide repeat protein [Micromonospora sp. NPDC048839]|uniref:tetratricopeptide repeat protein n=1 Tax=Micromonospora sp. NPDC048839 TaxID=3155641 RepID=UPI0033C89055